MMMLNVAPKKNLFVHTVRFSSRHGHSSACLFVSPLDDKGVVRIRIFFLRVSVKYVVNNLYNGPHSVMLYGDIKRGVLGRIDTYNDYSMHGMHCEHFCCCCVVRYK